MEQEFDIRGYLNVLKRRFPHFLIPAVLLFSGVLAVALTLPKSYLARATILVESQQIPSELARSTVTSAAAERIEVIRQRLMIRSNLLEIVRELNLFPELQNSLSQTQLVQLMRSATNIQQTNPAGPYGHNSSVISFTVSFEYGDADMAARVANRFVTLILEQNIRSRTERASETKKFFEQRVGDLEKELTKQEALIVKFKSENEAALPDSLGYRRTLLTDIQSRLPAVEQKILELEVQLELLKPNADGVVADDSDPLTQEIEALRRQLNQMKSEYSDRHPAVKRAQSRLAALVKERTVPAAERTVAEDGQENGDVPEEEGDVRLADDVKREGIERQLASLKEQRSTQLARITQLEQSLVATPQVEIALNALNREYEGLETQLADARVKMAEASVGERLEEDRQAERFEVIEHASAPDGPTKPNRKKIVFAGFVFSIAAGVGMVLLFEILDRSIRSARDLQNSLQMRPIAVIPVVHTIADAKSRVRRRLLILLAGVVLACAVAGILHVYYQPLDILWLKVLQKAGF